MVSEKLKKIKKKLTTISLVVTPTPNRIVWKQSFKNS